MIHLCGTLPGRAIDVETASPLGGSWGSQASAARPGRHVRCPGASDRGGPAAGARHAASTSARRARCTGSWTRPASQGATSPPPPLRGAGAAATRPNDVWSWESLLGPRQVDVFLSLRHPRHLQYVVGWMLAPRESAALAERPVSNGAMRTVARHDEQAGRPSPRRSRRHEDAQSPPRSNDNPFSEATLPSPERFGSLAMARAGHHFFAGNRPL